MVQIHQEFLLKILSVGNSLREITNDRWLGWPNFSEVLELRNRNRRWVDGQWLGIS
jgi:hypothetical protein